MGTALFTGVTGLQVHQRRLDVIASNIANVNTVGYRGSRVLFQDLFSQTLQGGAAPIGNFGGSNPQQVGLGVRVGSIDVNHSQGSLITTGVSSDLAIQGNGFFVLSNGTTNFFSRDGSFQLNANGLLIEPATGMRVQGYLADTNGTVDTSGIATDIFLPLGGGGIVRETSVANFTGNLNADAIAGSQHTFSIESYDSLGTAREIRMTFTKTSTNGQWTWEATYDNGTTTPVVGSGTVNFGANGELDTGSPGTISINAAAFGTLDAYPSLPFDFDLDFTAMTQLSAGVDSVSGDPLGSDVTLRNQDGFPLGVLESFNISANGQINGVFTNGLTRTVGVVSLATFSNVGGLSRDGNNLFRETPASGSAQVGAPQTGGRGTVTGGVLENSNVDLGSEFSNLIITQRGFQANARTITAADTLLQETVNLVR